MSIEATRFLDSGGLCSHVARQAELIFEAIEKSGLHGGEPGKSRVVGHQHIHDPGIQQEPINFAQFITVCRRSKWSKHLTNSPFLALLATDGSKRLSGNMDWQKYSFIR